MADWQSWKTLFHVRAGLSEDLRKAAIEYGKQHQRVTTGAGAGEQTYAKGETPRSVLFDRESAVLRLSLLYATTVQTMEDLKSPLTKKKAKNARRT